MKSYCYISAILLLFFSTHLCIGQTNTLLAKVWVGTKCGFIDTLGNYKINPEFPDVRDFSEGFAAAKYKSKWGYIDTSGKFVIEPIYAIARNFNDGRAVVYVNQKWFFINKKGEIVISGYDALTDFNDGYASVKDKLKWGIINTKGEVIVPIVHNHMKMPVERRAIIKDEGKYGFINLKNQLIIQNKYDMIDQFSEGIAKAGCAEGLGYIDTTGKWIFRLKRIENSTSINLAYDLGFCKEGRIFIKGSYYHTYAIFDSAGNKLTGFNYRHYQPFSEGLAAVEIKDEEWGYVNKKGELVFDPIYISAKEFSNGYAAVKLSENFILQKKDNIEYKMKWGFINKKGMLVIPPKFDVCSKFYDPMLTFPDKFD